MSHAAKSPARRLTLTIKAANQTLTAARAKALSITLVLACACGPALGGDTGTEGGTGSSSSAPDTESTTGPSSTTTTSDPTVGSTASTSTSTGTVDDSSTGEPASVCDPQPMDIVASVSFDGGALPEDPLANPYTYDCTIATWTEGDAAVTLELECVDGDHTLVLGTSVGVWFDKAGDFVVTVFHSNDTFGGEDQLVTLRRTDGELVLAGASTPWAPDHAELPPDFFAPLSITRLADVCEVEPLAPDGGNFVAPCFAVERQALRFALQGEALDVYDHGVDQLPPYILAVQHAERRHDITCTDIGDTWFSWVAAPPLPD